MIRRRDERMKAVGSKSSRVLEIRTGTDEDENINNGS